jgi:tetratricopeptide (TPR) repeat protein
VLLSALFVVFLHAVSLHAEEAHSNRATFIAEPANPLTDSLRAAITNAGTDSARVDALNTLARALRFTKFSEAIRRASEALAISERIGYVNGSARAHYNIGYANTRMGAYAQALESHVTALLLYEKTGNRLGTAYCYMDMGNISMYREEYTKTKEYLFKALPILVQTQDKEGMSICTNNLGVTFEKMRMYDSSLYWHQQSLAVKLQRADSAGGLRIHILILARYIFCKVSTQKRWNTNSNHSPYANRLATVILWANRTCFWVKFTLHWGMVPNH